MDEESYCDDPALGEVLRQYFQGGNDDIPGSLIKDALSHLRACRACEDEHPDAAKDSHAWHAAIIGERIPVGPGESTQAENHWRSCDRCQQEHPEGLSELASIKAKAREEAKREIIRLYHDYETTRHAMLSKMEEYPQEEHSGVISEMLASLASKAPLIGWELDFFHEMGGMTDFYVFPNAEDSEALEAWRGVNALIRSVPEEIQQFIFSARLCGDLFGQNLNEDELLVKIHNELGNSIDCGTLMRTVEAAAEEVRRVYLEQNPELEAHNLATAPSKVEDDSPMISVKADLQRIETKVSDIKDQVASVQAVQMEQQWELERINPEPSEYVPELQTKLGETYARLEPATQELLQQGEWDYKHARTRPAWANSASNFAKAFENELKVKIMRPVARKIRDKFGKYCKPVGAHAPLVVNGAPNEKLALGNAQWYLRLDPDVRQIGAELGVNIGQLIDAIDDLKVFRDPASHSVVSPDDAEKVRDMILGPRSILNLLFPSTGSG